MIQQKKNRKPFSFVVRKLLIELFDVATDGEREAAGLLSNSRINNGTGTTTRSQEMVYHAAEELLLNHQSQQQQNELSDDQPRRRSVNFPRSNIEPLEPITKTKHK